MFYLYKSVKFTLSKENLTICFRQKKNSTVKYINIENILNNNKKIKLI